MKFYAVRDGRKPGIYTTWPACEAQVREFPRARYKSFSTREDAKAFLAGASPAATPAASAATRQTTNVVHIWVDGAWLQQGEEPPRFGWAYVILNGEQELHRGKGHAVPADAQQHRNVAAEIQAVVHALTWCRNHGITTATIYFDYQGLASWVQGAWKTRTPFTQSYVAQVRALGMQLTWKKVRAHSGEKYNELVDQLAKEAARPVRHWQRATASH
ncbi:MAG: ribonuclease H family protein [Nitrospira sp.]|nr:ribonuclease H family protein [Nitrospira sp.]